MIGRSVPCHFGRIYMSMAVQQHFLSPGSCWVVTSVPITDVFVLNLGSTLQIPQGKNTKPNREKGFFRLDSPPRGPLLLAGSLACCRGWGRQPCHVTLLSPCSPLSPSGSVIEGTLKCLGSPIAGHLQEGVSETLARGSQALCGGTQYLWINSSLSPAPRAFPASSGPDVFLEGGGECLCGCLLVLCGLLCFEGSQADFCVPSLCCPRLKVK